MSPHEARHAYAMHKGGLSCKTVSKQCEPVQNKGKAMLLDERTPPDRLGTRRGGRRPKAACSDLARARQLSLLPQPCAARFPHRNQARVAHGYAGRVGHLPWGENVYDAVRTTDFDCVLYQFRSQWEVDSKALGAGQRRLPAICLEHDPPQAHPTASLHWVQDPNVVLVHVTAFNALMWDSVTPTRVIPHGVVVPLDCSGPERPNGG